MAALIDFPYSILFLFAFDRRKPIELTRPYRDRLRSSKVQQSLPLRMVQPSMMKMIKSFLNRWQSFPEVGGSYSHLSSYTDPFHDDINDWDDVNPPNSAETRPSILVHTNDHQVDEAPERCTAVYVGKCRRRYLIRGEYLNHPLLRVLIVEQFKDGYLVPCEVVLFEHSVWMLKNSNPEAIQSDSSFEDLAQFYVSK